MDSTTCSPRLESGDASGRGSLSIGATFGKYLLTGQLGQGSSALVYRATHTKLDIPVALKLMRVEARPEIWDQFQREARLLARLNHPNILRLWDFDNQPSPYLATEYVDGLNLLELLRQSGPMRPDRVVEIARQCTLGLIEAWQHGIIHRDIKPANLLLTRQGGVKIADLGLAALLHQPDEDPRFHIGSELAGTAAYMAPEQARRSTELDHRSDIYALGATLYEALTERLPFPGRSIQEVLLKHNIATLVPPHEIAPHVPQSLSTVVVKMMARRPEDRYQTGEALLDALDSVHFGPAFLGALDTIVEHAAISDTLHDDIESVGLRDTTVEQRKSSQALPLSKQIERAVSMAHAGRIRGALTQLQCLAHSNPDQVDIWIWLGRLAETPAQAVAHLQAALSLQPRHPELVRSFVLASTQAIEEALATDQSQLALRYAQELLIYAPEHPEALKLVNQLTR